VTQRMEVTQGVSVLKSGEPALAGGRDPDRVRDPALGLAPAGGRAPGRVRDPAGGRPPGRVRAQVGLSCSGGWT